MNQMQLGIKHEKEHGSLYDMLANAIKTKGIKMPISKHKFFEETAKVHLNKMSDYYSRLKKMEGEND